MDWDQTLGANNLDTLLAAHFAAQFAEKNKLDAKDVLGNAKAMAKMKKQVGAGCLAGPMKEEKEVDVNNLWGQG